MNKLLVLGFTSTDSINKQNGIGEVIFILFIFLAILIAAYITAKYYARYENRKQTSKQMKVLETVTVGPNKYIQLIRVGSQYFVIGLSKDHINFLTEVDASAFSKIEEIDENPSQTLFSYFLKSEKEKKMENSENESNHKK